MSKIVNNRVNFASVKNPLPYPDFLDVQLKSFRDFLQLDTPPEKRKNEICGNIQMGQRQTKALNADVLDWTRLGNMGIDRQTLEASGELDRLLEGRETGVMTLRLRTGLVDITTDATLRIVSDDEGRPVLQVNGVDKEKMQL